ncbi:bleomycin resistance protein [Dyella mobilis]|uniref:Bleomycin resistance protein n=1 Tax=Dyella mobilis TaxID=1849582 RepID=A0ABS2KFF2_9GAMM|nr:VOC family protein [Dyella mobilis]MBM7129610.1 VOC family protein [Dyella mobilis]GLQ98126.1 bleomycin resistance protein [Dyella mobilis]
MSQTVIPQLRITRAAASLQFYVHGLGFMVDWQHQVGAGAPLFIQLTRSGQTIFLTERAGDCEVGGAVYFSVPDVDECYRKFHASGVAIANPPKMTPWGTREIVVTDPDGNRLRFSTAVAR